jgi:hypothetical protein
MASKA